MQIFQKNYNFFIKKGFFNFDICNIIYKESFYIKLSE